MTDSLLVGILLISGFCTFVAMLILFVAMLRSLSFLERHIGEKMRLGNRRVLFLSPKQMRGAWPAFKGYIKDHRGFYSVAAVALGIWFFTPIILLASVILSRP